MYFITTKRMLEVCFSAHPNIQYRTDIINIDTWIISFLERPSKGRIFYTKKSVAISQRKGLIPCQHEANTLDSPTVMVLSVTWERNVKTLTPSIPQQTSTEIGPRPYAMLIPG